MVCKLDRKIHFSNPVYKEISRCDCDHCARNRSPFSGTFLFPHRYINIISVRSLSVEKMM